MALFEKKEEPMVSPAEAECDRRLAELARNRAEIVMQIGMLFLANNSVEKVAGTPYEQLVKNVEAIDKESVFQEKRKLAVKGLRRCEKCGNILVLDSAFCNKCGEKLEPLFEQANNNQSVCPNCGEPHGTDAAFCTSCGHKLG